MFEVGRIAETEDWSQHQRFVPEADIRSGDDAPLNFF